MRTEKKGKTDDGRGKGREEKDMTMSEVMNKTEVRSQESTTE
jgi:hypothetical protein